MYKKEFTISRWDSKNTLKGIIKHAKNQIQSTLNNLSESEKKFKIYRMVACYVKNPRPIREVLFGDSISGGVFRNYSQIEACLEYRENSDRPLKIQPCLYINPFAKKDFRKSLFYKIFYDVYKEFPHYIITTKAN